MRPSLTLQNWAGNVQYQASSYARPTTIEQLQSIVASSDRVRALGSRHSFSELADSTGTLVSLELIPADIDIDTGQRCVTVGAGVLYGALAQQLHQAGWALANLASLPHISVGGAVATATHGSGDDNRCLSAAVRALEVIGPDGELRSVQRGDPDFQGMVVGLGALGIVTRVTLDIEPTYLIRQRIYAGLPLDSLEQHAGAVMGSGYSVSLFLTWNTPRVEQVWVKAREEDLPDDFFGARAATETLHMLPGGPTEAVTEQHGVEGAWSDRLPHFRAAFTPSSGLELQSEYLLPRTHTQPAIVALRSIGDRFRSVLQISEIRTVAADDLWLSGAYGRDTTAIHFTWVRDVPGVFAVLPIIEQALVPLGARPHWGKCFLMRPEELDEAYPRMTDFRQLLAKLDHGGKFSNDFVERMIRPVR